ncbi:MAG TPA: hypothetical protein VM008_21885 [Phycisphaerae bacterium]|nr:hypothetical protein [Phycisphaerae bacterium]
MTNTVSSTGAPAPSGGGMPKWLIILLVVLLVISIGCCGGVATCFWWVRNKAPAFLKEKMREQGIEMNLPDATGTAAMPSNFPADIPVYTGAKTIQSTANLKLNGGEAGLQTSDSIADVKSFYDKEMADQGWKEENSGSSAADEQHMSYSKDTRFASVQMNRHGTTTSIVITYGKK